MAILKTGNMMDVLSEVDYFVVCVSSNLRRADDSLVMLNGIGGQLVAKFPGIDKKIGNWIKENHGDAGIFWFRGDSKVCLFQNMVLVRQGYSLALISKAAAKLKEMALANPGKTFALEHPRGDDPAWLMKDILASLPDNVTVWDHE